MQLTEEQIQFFILALYDLDSFRKKLNERQLPKQDNYPPMKEACKDDEQLLLFGIEWLHGVLFQ